jgi:peptidoglycan/LPS O-acetylase OafA/YrhL
VDIFFVLSGFLVSGLLFAEFKRTGTLSVGRFLLRRGFKIYPAFWVMIGATALVRCWTHDELGLPFNLMGELLFIQNYAGNIGNLWGHTWSLAVEEHFYFLLAALCWLLVTKSKAGIRSLPVVFAVIAIGCLALRVSAATQLSPSSWIGANQLPPDVCFTVLFPTHLRLDSLMCGVAVAYWWHFCMSAQQIKAASRWWIACVVVGMAFCLPAFVWDLSECLWVPVLGVVAFYIGAAFIMIGLHVAPGLPATKFAVATAWLGTHSYSVYLWHRPTQAWGARLMEAWLGHRPSWVVLGLVYLVASWMVGVTLAKLIETPALRLR